MAKKSQKELHIINGVKNPEHMLHLIDLFAESEHMTVTSIGEKRHYERQDFMEYGKCMDVLIKEDILYIYGYVGTADKPKAYAKQGSAGRMFGKQVEHLAEVLAEMNRLGPDSMESSAHLYEKETSEHNQPESKENQSNTRIKVFRTFVYITVCACVLIAGIYFYASHSIDGRGQVTKLDIPTMEERGQYEFRAIIGTKQFYQRNYRLADSYTSHYYVVSDEHMNMVVIRAEENFDNQYVEGTGLFPDITTITGVARKMSDELQERTRYICLKIKNDQNIDVNMNMQYYLDTMPSKSGHDQKMAFVFLILAGVIFVIGTHVSTMQFSKRGVKLADWILTFLTVSSVYYVIELISLFHSYY